MVGTNLLGLAALRPLVAATPLPPEDLDGENLEWDREIKRTEDRPPEPERVPNYPRRWNRNPRPQPQNLSKLVFIIYLC